MHGYSSSEESDDPRRPKTPVSTGKTSDDQKKKKKKVKPPPQQTINHIWKTFQKRKFNKALAVLPFDPVLPPASPERPNGFLDAGYERAAEECRRKVKKIIQECRRVNTRYRDPGWDLDWDLKWAKGNCLNHLGYTKWSVSRSSLATASATVPKAVKRVHEIFEKPTFMKNVSGDDVKQGSLGDCWLIASLTALANVPGGLKRLCVEYDTRIGIYGFVFFRDGEWIYSIIDDKLYLKSPAWDSRSMQRELFQQIDREDQERVYRKTYQTGSKALFFGQNRDQNETWVPLLEKAYAKAHGDYASLIGGWIGEALEDLSGGVTTEILASDILDTDGFWDELTKVNQEFLFGCTTGLLEYGYGDRDGIYEGHAYVVLEARKIKSGECLVKLRNPWGKIRRGIWEGAWSDGSKEWTPDVQEELGHHFGNDSTFWISYEDFLNKFQHFDRTRLFREPDWRCCQRWIGVEVPWKPEYHEKFRFTLTKDSPMVLVLSQLDDRYFKGLQGQYSFRLQFRIHEKGRPSSEDYFVRSHGNYLMDRSVAVEVPDMPAGEYSIFISVAGVRDLRLPSIEDVVRRECKDRVQNEKLAQVGYAYDLAHSKGTAYLEAVADLRKTKEREKASGMRQKERRKLWERRHVNREVNRKQKKKDTERRERKRRKKLALEKEADNKSMDAPETEKVDKEDKSTPDPPEKASEDKGTRGNEGSVATTSGSSNDGAAVQKPPSSEGDDNDKSSAATDSSTGEKSSTPEEEKSDDQKARVDTPKTDAEESPVKNGEGDGAEENKKEAMKPSETSDDKATDKAKGGEEQTGADASEKDGEAAAEPEADPENTKPNEAELPPPPAAVEKAEAKIADKENGDKEGTGKEESKKSSSSKKSKAQTKESSSTASDGETSDSPIEDYELMYSSDDMIRKPRLSPAQPPLPKSAIFDSEDENAPEPWNAICILGIHLYSQDEKLDLRVVLEGDDLSEGVMGKKGEADIDNAQANAGGEREKEPGLEPVAEPILEEPNTGLDDGNDADTEDDDGEEKRKGKAKEKKKKVEEGEKKEGDGEGEGKQKSDGSEQNEDCKSEKSADSSEYDKLDSGVSTPGEVVVTPQPTPPLEETGNKELA